MAGDPNPQPHSTGANRIYVCVRFKSGAERRNVQEHGSVVYGQLLARLFGELFPPE
jgi:hypothetical protein